jgi:hypothetical protein
LVKPVNTKAVNKPTYKITGDSQFELRLNRFTRWQHIAMLACGILAAIAIFLYIAITVSIKDGSNTESPVPMQRPESRPAVAPSGQGGSIPSRLTSSGVLPPPKEFSIWDQTGKGVRPATGTATSTATGSSSEAQRALDQIVRMMLNNKSLTSEQAAQINEWLKTLAAQGSAAVPVIAAFLKQGDDLSFDAVPGGENVQYGSLRLGLVDLLGQIGTAESAALAHELLSSTTNPLEIALLSRAFLGLSDETYRQAAVQASLSALQRAMTGESRERDVSPLFETLQRYGDESVSQTLRDAVERWNYYATLSLAGLPDGAGIPTLIELAGDPDVLAMGNGDFALRVLAQVAMQYPDAQTALLNQARTQQVPDTAWPTVASALAGNHIQYGIQIFGSTSTSVKWTPDSVNQRIAYIDRLLSSGVSATGITALQAARQSLLQRLSQL